jgi:3-oxoacyl-[acyl-carrier protein] reductase
MMRKSPAARIVNISTVAVPLRLEGEAVYAASKSAPRPYADRREGSGAVRHHVQRRRPLPDPTKLTAGVPDAKIQTIIDAQAVRRWAPADVVNVIDFFLRPESAMVTGQVVYLGGVG